MKTTFFQIIIFLILCISCSSQNKISKSNIEREIPIWHDEKLDLFYQLVQQKRKQLKLKNLANGFDSLQIRIWYNVSLSDKEKLVIFEQKKSIWRGYYYRLEVEWDAFKLTEKIKKSKKIEITPKSGWAEFIPKILNKEIQSLPDMDDIKGLNDSWSDGKTYSVEISTKEKYRFYNYHLPEKFQEFKEAKNMLDILEIIEDEFGIKK